MPNRLARETSPYLLQHADNPVDWYPWGPEALERARAEDRPILLSIGYSACHWCHVMERESFEDPATADLMNEHFVNIKVDREERPDIDAIYMRAVQALTGQGGWPLTAFLTPAGEPYFGGTYFPPERRQGMPAFREVLSAVAEAYRNRRSEVDEAAGHLRGVLERSTRPAEAPDESLAAEETLDRAFGGVRSQFDAARGGFGGAPKFPQPVVLDFLLRHHRRTGKREALDMVLRTLSAMAHGGIRDQLDGGFHRYTVDARWLVPHFEKMLYDNALLARVYLHAFLITGERWLADTGTATLDYCLADLVDPAGGFYAARDADSEGEEGLFYLWTPEQVTDVLGADRARVFMRAYDVSEAGNFEGRSILHLPHDLEALARAESMELEELQRELAEDRKRLLGARQKREHPFRDEKVLTGWNGMMLRTLAEAGGALERADYVSASARGIRFVFDALASDDRLRHSWKDGKARVDGFLEDYAAVGNAALALHEVTLDPESLRRARWCCDRILDLFLDGDTGLLFDTPADGEDLLVRPREMMDNATPSGPSLAVELLLRAADLFGVEQYRAVAMATLRAEASAMERYPLGFGRLLAGLELAVSGTVQVVLVGPPDDPTTRDLQAALLRRHQPDRVVLGWDGSDPELADLPLLRGRTMTDGRPTAFVCRDMVCRLPVTDPAALVDQLP